MLLKMKKGPFFRNKENIYYAYINGILKTMDFYYCNFDFS